MERMEPPQKNTPIASRNNDALSQLQELRMGR